MAAVSPHRVNVHIGRTYRPGKELEGMFSMQIAIDYTVAMRQEGGGGAYTRNLVAALLKQDTSNHYLLLTGRRVDEARPFPRADNVRTRSIPLPERTHQTPRSRWRLPLPTTFFTGPIDIYHSPDYLLPRLSRHVRKIITIRDLTFLEHPEYLDAAQVTYLQRIVPEAVANADSIIATSRQISEALARYFQTPRDKILTPAPGVASYFRPLSDPLLLAATRYKFGLRQPFVLTVGRQEPQKNHLGLLKAFQQISRKKNGVAQLVIIGEAGRQTEELQQFVEQEKLAKKVRFLNRVSDLELITLYNMAAVCVFPAFYTGSGTAALEAMACGTPVIAANTGALAEVTGDAALRIDPRNPGTIAQAIARVLGDEGLREELRGKGYARAQQYSWENVARQLLSIYQQMYNRQTAFADKEASL